MASFQTVPAARPECVLRMPPRPTIIGGGGRYVTLTAPRAGPYSFVENAISIPRRHVMNNLNLYGDSRSPTISSFGVDIAMQRADDLDKMAIDRVSSIGAELKQLGKAPRALDVGSASGGQAFRMVDAGATVTALDVDDYSQEFLSAAKQAGWENRCSFLQQDITKFKVADSLESFHVIVCQRMIHYVPYATALEIVADLRRALTEDGRLYISASGLHSELGNGYSARSKPVPQRYVALSDEMSSKHAIKGPVCLYSAADLARLLEDAGMRVEQVFASPFGNIKAVAKP